MFEALRSEHSLRTLGKPGANPGPWELAWQAEHLEGASPWEILEWAVATYGNRLALSASFGGPEGMALIDMLSKITDEVTILTIDTGFLFKETHEFREEVMRRYQLPLEVLRSKLSALRRADAHLQPGPVLPGEEDRAAGAGA
jgi:phosphoadenosine phosphosulfate reductase